MSSHEAHRSGRSRRESRYSRSTSPYPAGRQHETSRKRKRSVSRHKVTLPFKATPLDKNDFSSNQALFALYLDVQKQLIIDDLKEREIKGRWKSFYKKWNRGELAEGWYDPTTKQRAIASAIPPATATHPTANRRPSPDYGPSLQSSHLVEGSDEDDFGPAVPTQMQHPKRAGPAIPSMQDLQLRDELRAEDRGAAREDLNYTRKEERSTQKERLEEIVPRADTGSRERQLEKKQEIAGTHASFREAKDGGAEEVVDSDLMGDDGIEGYKKRKVEAERKKTERELRKEEIWRAKAEERAERLKVHKEKEDKTLDMLRAMARQRYG